MEEMQATQEEMRRREVELQGALEKMGEVQAESEKSRYEADQFYRVINDTFNVVTFSAEGVITNISQNLLHVWGVTRDVFVDKHYAELVGDEGYIPVWEHMIKGEYFADVRPVTTHTGKTLVFRHNFMPICDNQGVLMQVILFAFHEND
jgi:PAS domain-containing protein